MLTGSSPFAAAFAVNLGYLQQFPVDDMLYWFRRRAGVANPPGATSWGWDGQSKQIPSLATENLPENTNGLLRPHQ